MASSSTYPLCARACSKEQNVNVGQVSNDAVLQKREQRAKGTTVRRLSHRKKVARAHLNSEQSHWRMLKEMKRIIRLRATKTVTLQRMEKDTFTLPAEGSIINCFLSIQRVCTMWKKDINMVVIKICTRFGAVRYMVEKLGTGMKLC